MHDLDDYDEDEVPMDAPAETNKKWYVIEEPNGTSYSPFRKSKRIIEYVGDGEGKANPKAIVDYLNTHKGADYCDPYFERQIIEETDSIECDLPSGVYKYYSSGNGRYTERLIPFELRTDFGIDLGDIAEEVREKIGLFLSREDVYRNHDILYKLGMLLYGPPGCGKCLGKGTPVLMHDGTIKPVEDILVGAELMGPDSQPRRVVSVSRGREKMYRVVPSRGDSFECNESHILSLRGNHGGIKGKIINISVRDFLKSSNTFKHHSLLWRTGVEFNESILPIDPYMLGCWLGDGTSATSNITNVDLDVLERVAVCATASGLSVKPVGKTGITYRIGTGSKGKGLTQKRNPFLTALKKLELINNKHIPHEYKTGSREQRLQLLAGLLDTDGSVSGPGYEFTNKSKELCEDLAFVARSLGFAAYVTPLTKSCTYLGEKKTGNYFRVGVSGEMSEIPVISRKICKKRVQNKNVLNMGFKLEDLGEGDYYGFEISGNDRLFLLGDFTVTHNTTIIRRIVHDLPKNTLVIMVSEKFPSGDFLAKVKETLPDCLKVFVFEELANSINYYELGRVLDFLDGETSIDRSIVIGTTNYPERIPGNIIERPSRFDDVFLFGNPKDPERKKLLTYFLKRDATVEEITCTKGLSIDGIKQVCLLSFLYNISIDVAVKRMKARIALCKKEFNSQEKTGF